MSLFPGVAYAQATPERFVADIELQTEADLEELLMRAEQLLIEGRAPQDGEAAVIFVLHGPVLRALLRNNYTQSKSVVDRAASLSALGVVDIKACRAWMGANQVSEEQLQPFVETVSYGPAEVDRLVQEQGYYNF